MPSSYYEDTFVDNVQSTLCEMGHEVQTEGYVTRNTYSSHSEYARRVLHELAFGNKPTRKDYALLNAVREFKPDLFLSTTGSTHPEILDEVGKIVGNRRILWWGDAPANSQRWGILDPGWDIVYIKDREAVNKLRMAGRQAYLLHEAMNPKWHRPIAKQSNDSVIVAGSYYAFRQAIVLRLLNDGLDVQLYGSTPPRWAHPQIKEHHSGRYITREEKSRVFGEGMACLNTFHFAEGDSLNCRAFEIAGAGGLQLIENRKAIEDCFEPSKEVLVFSSYEELLDQIDRTRRSPQTVLKVRESGAARAHAEHTYRHRLDIVISNI